MEGFKAKEYKIFELFDKQWAIVTAGSMAHYNSCTVSWGSLGNIWGHAGHSCPIVTVYVHPARYTSEFLRDSDIFTVSFYPEIIWPRKFRRITPLRRRCTRTFRAAGSRT